MKQWFSKISLVTVVILTPLAARGASCTGSVTALSFGTYTGVQLTSTNVITTSCPSPVTSYTIALDQGTGSGATTTTRVMTGPSSARLNYQLFQNASHTMNWGNTTGTDTVTVTGNSSVNSTVYALMAAGQAPTPGSYTDTITGSVVSSLGTLTGTFAVTATISAACTLAANSLAFGTYTGTQLSVQSSVTATCTNTTPYNVGLSAGTSSGATVTTRKMTGPSSTLLSYNIYRTSASANWGNTVGTDTVSGTGSGAAQALTVYGMIPAGQYVRPGSYADTITATITY